ncbi:MAG: hypothetical protein QNJ69_00315 [Gammaproteobacteria bacterium]|nr:hypothetical protein [Gammaproteobacteria bacterium]
MTSYPERPAGSETMTVGGRPTEQADRLKIYRLEPGSPDTDAKGGQDLGD